jgi:prevent-host-death family protein
MKSFNQNTATIVEAKNNLSQLIRKVKNGETIIITRGRKRTPIAALRPPLESKNDGSSTTS